MGAETLLTALSKVPSTQGVNSLTRAPVRVAPSQWLCHWRRPVDGYTVRQAGGGASASYLGNLDPYYDHFLFRCLQATYHRGWHKHVQRYVPARTRIDNLPVMGRLVVVQRHKGVASNYDCGPCPCPAGAWSLTVSPGTGYLCPASAENGVSCR